jgi:uncharacterized OsmC-like protein
MVSHTSKSQADNPLNSIRDVAVQVRVSRPERERLKRIAAERRCTISDLLRNAVTRIVEN